jgi:hypothetical protein
MSRGEVVIKLSHDQALVLSDWLERMETSRAFAQVVDDRAVWSALHRISGTLDKSLVNGRLKLTPWSTRKVNPLGVG